MLIFYAQVQITLTRSFADQVMWNTDYKGMMEFKVMKISVQSLIQRSD